MGRIFIDTDELRSLARTFRSESGGLADLALDLTRARGQTPPPPADLVRLGAQAANVEARIHNLGGQLVGLGSTLDNTSSEVDADQARIASILTVRTGWPRFVGRTGTTSHRPTNVSASESFYHHLKSVLDFSDRTAGAITKQFVKTYDRTINGELRTIARYARGWAPIFNKAGSAKQLKTLSRTLSWGMFAFGGLEQAFDDRHLHLTPAQRVTRAATTGGLELAGGIAGGAAGAAVGGVIGGVIGAPFFPPAGAVVGAAIGSVVGRVAGTYGGVRAADWAKDKLFKFKPLHKIFGG